MKVNLTSHELIRCLNGFLCVYKQRDVSLASVKKTLMKRVSSTINSLEPLPVPTIKRPIVEPHRKSKALVVVGMEKQLDYTLHPLCGSAMREDDVLFDEVEPMEATTSGVCLFAVNEGTEKLELVRESGWVNQYVVNGVLGEESDKHMLRSKVVSTIKYDHVSKNTFEKLLSRVRHQYRRLSYELSNVDIQSEEAFEIAQSGAVRPKVLGSPIIYDAQLVQFEPPLFQLKIICTGENDKFLRGFVHELGCSMNTVARPTRLQRIQFGPFLRSHALLDKYFQLPTIIKNIRMCNKMIEAQLDATKGSKHLKTMDKNESLSYINEYFLQPERQQQELDTVINEGLENGDAFKLPWGRNYD